MCIAAAVGGRLRVCSVERRTLPLHIRNCLHIPRPLAGNSVSALSDADKKDAVTQLKLEFRFEEIPVCPKRLDILLPTIRQ